MHSIEILAINASLVPRPLPFFNVAHKKREGLVCKRMCMTPLCVIPTSHSQEGCLFQATIFKRKVCKYNWMHTSQPYLRSATKRSAHKNCWPWSRPRPIKSIPGWLLVKYHTPTLVHQALTFLGVTLKSGSGLGMRLFKAISQYRKAVFKRLNFAALYLIKRSSPFEKSLGDVCMHENSSLSQIYR